MLERRLYALLLRLYPRPFRAEFEESMLELFDRRRRGSRSPSLWAHLTLDLLRSLPREWLAVLRRRSRSRASGRRREPFGALARELRFAARSLRRERGTLVLAAFLLAAGIGATAAIFTLVNGVLARPVPYPEAERIVRLWAHLPEEEIERFSFTKIEYRTYAEENEVFEAIGGEFPLSLTIEGDEGEPERVQASYVTPGFFDVFGAAPRLGRGITFADLDSGDPMVAVIGHGLWRRRFGSEPGVVGRLVRLDGESFTVLGVLPDGFRHPETDTDVYIPYTIGTEGWIGRWLWLYARLSPNVSVDRAQAELDSLTASIGETQVRTDGWAMEVAPFVETIVGPVRFALWVLLGAVLLLFALAAVNAANLLLVRAAATRHLVGLRAALGAGRFQMVRQNVLEGALVAVLGVAGGGALAHWLLPLLLRLGRESLPRLARPTVDLRVLAFVASVALASLVLVSVVPALFSMRSMRSGGALADRSRVGGDRGTQRLLRSLVVVETALAVAILAAAGLMAKSFLRLSQLDPGFRPASVTALSVSLPKSRYSEPRAITSFFDRLVERLEALPATESAAIAAYLPLDGRGALSALNSEARAREGFREPISSLQRIVSAGFFRTVGVPLLAGRTFDEPPPEGALHQVVLGERLARLLFGDEDPVGKRVTTRSEPGPDDWREVVGVVGDVRYVGLTLEPQAQFYESRHERTWGAMSVVVRTRERLDAFAGMARESVRELDAQVPVFGFTPLEGLVGRSAARPRFHLVVFAIFAVVALVLACGGIYGVLSFVTRQRVREIGVRMAFGASRNEVLGSVMRSSLALVAAGTAIGGVLAILSSRALGALLFSVSPRDPETYAIVAALLIASAMAASYLPARRASRVDPMEALRSE